MTCQGHEYSMEKRETTVINLDAHPDLVALYRAINDPKVAAILKSFGIDKEVEYVYQGHRRIKLVTYVITASDPQEAKRLINKLIETLPEFLDDDDKQTINNAIDHKAREERQVVVNCPPNSKGKTITVTEEYEITVAGALTIKYKKITTIQC